MSEKDRELLLKQLQKAKEETEEMINAAIENLNEILKEIDGSSDKSINVFLVEKLVKDSLSKLGYGDIVLQRIEKIKNFLENGDNKEELNWRIEEGVKQEDIDSLFD